jgi:HTH-type transcriptional regulator/antitoxin HigA
MDQQTMAPKDLVPYLGSASRVSEVLSGKRPLSLAMIRSLHRGLGIPLESLFSEEVDATPSNIIEWDRFPIRELLKRGWVEGAATGGKRLGFSESQELMERFFRPVGGLSLALGVLHKTDVSRRASRTSDRFALAAWAARILQRANLVKLDSSFDREEWTETLFGELRGLSKYDEGPRLALRFLANHGIVVILEAHLKRTRLDGAAMLRTDGTPVIGLTLRHDRVDNFWFTLFHELMHVIYHLKQTASALNISCFIDELEGVPPESAIEREADDAARDALIPRIYWENSAAKFVVAPTTVVQLARLVGIAPAIVAGRVRHERKNYRLLSSMIGAAKVQEQFPEIAWPTESE